jgi:hypothetical protein
MTGNVSGQRETALGHSNVVLLDNVTQNYVTVASSLGETGSPNAAVRPSNCALMALEDTSHMQVWTHPADDRVRGSSAT